MGYSQYLKSKHWQRVRRRALKRAGWHCSVCADEKNLDVHHNSYERLSKERMSDIVVLCRVCHGLYHGKRAKSKLSIPPIGDLENLKKILHM